MNVRYYCLNKRILLNKIVHCAALSLMFLMTATLTRGQKATPIQLGDRREIFVDDFLIERMTGVSLRMHAPRNEGPVLYFDEPWEGQFSAYCTIIRDGNLYRAYYRGIPEAGKDGDNMEVTCNAESLDGIKWVKPNLKIYKIGRTLDNNVLLANAAPATHNFSPFLDSNPNVLPDQRYKAIGGLEGSGLLAYVSEDGIHWKRLQEKSIFTKGIFDSQNVAFWSQAEGQYVCYFRTFIQVGSAVFRTVSRTTSPDFIHWSEPVRMGFGDTPYEHIYTQQTSPYYRAPHIYLAIGARFMPDRQVVSAEQAKRLGVQANYFQDCSDAILMSTRGGDSYQRTFMESFLRPGIGLQNWVSRSNYPALNVVQTSPTEMSVYVNENYAQPTAHLKRYSLRIDGFCSVEAPFSGGDLLTKPLIFDGDELEINFSTSAAGEIRVEILDVNETPVSGYTLREADALIGNEIKRVVSWKGGEDLRSLSGKIIRLRIWMKDANLFSLKFNDLKS